MTILPSPNVLLDLNPQDNPAFSNWYPNQDRAMSVIIDWLVNPNMKYLCATLPTGSGKSLAAAITAKLSGMRTGVLTNTKGLQDQFMADFYQMGFHDIRGQNYYPCILLDGSGTTVDQGPCHAGISCVHRENDCTYYSKLEEASNSKFVVTNYSFWLAQAKTHAQRGGGIGRMELLIMDEADEAFGAIESYLQTHISTEDCRNARIQLPDSARLPDTWLAWKQWAHDQIPRVELTERRMRQDIQLTNGANTKGSDVKKVDINRIRQVQDLIRKLELLRGSVGDWVWRTTGGGRSGGGFGVLFTPVWPGQYSNLIFGNSKKVLVMSATLTPKTADLLGISKEERMWLEKGSAFAPYRYPVQHIQTIRVDHRATDVDMRVWTNRIDQIIDRRLDRKGIVLPVSYDRSDYFVRNSRHRDKIVTHRSGDVSTAVDTWRRSAAPSVLVSPSVGRGWDFPHDECRYVVIGKIPFPDGRDPVVKARNDGDSEFAGYDTMQTIVQETGRGMRSPTDWCETFIIDDHWGWFWNKNSQFAPEYFMNRLKKRTTVVPNPPPITGF